MSGQRLGYIRVSSLDQNTQRRLENIQVARMFTAKASGKDTKRPQLEELLRFARDGDTVVVHSMDRLARNLDDLRAVVQKLTRKGVRIEFLKEKPRLHRRRLDPGKPQALRDGRVRGIRAGTHR